MDKNMTFLSQNGITSTSANHISNMAKEAYQATEEELNQIQLYDYSISLIGGEQTLLKAGSGIVYLSGLKEKLGFIAQLKSLIAWLREAIKAKQAVVTAMETISNEALAATEGIEMPESPTAKSRLTEDEIVAEWDVKKRNRFYSLDTQCAVLGQFIHPKGAFSKARKDYANALVEPHKVEANGRDTLIYTKTPTVRVEDVDSVFFALQKSYREKQAELNSMKHEIEMAIQKDDQEKAVQERAEVTEYLAKMEGINANLKVLRNKKLEELRALKIVIPEQLKPIYQKVAAMGSSKE